MPLPAFSRTDSANTGKGISRHPGFTIIEMMIAVAVLAIITSLALPTYHNILEKREITSGGEQLAAFLSSAQMESVKQNQFVAVNYQPLANGWCLGMRAGDSAVTCDCSVTDVSAANACAVDGELRVFNSSNLKDPDILNAASVGDDGTILFDPERGLIRGAENVTLQLLSGDGSYALDVEVTVTGRVKICSNKAANKDVPGYKECSA